MAHKCRNDNHINKELVRVGNGKLSTITAIFISLTKLGSYVCCNERDTSIIQQNQPYYPVQILRRGLTRNWLSSTVYTL